MKSHLRLAAVGATVFALAAPASALAKPTLPAADCDDAAPGQTCVYWCPTNPGGGGGYHPCRINNSPLD
jgi:hypothetical protein